MQNPAFWGRFGLLWLLFIFNACWCASSNAADAKSDRGSGARSVVAVTSVAETSATALTVANSRSKSTRVAPAAASEPHAMPALNGFSLLILAASLGLAALWIWRKRP